MAVLLSPVGGVAAQFFTNAGVPLSGGKIFTYAAGTSTPQATYTTGAGNIQHSNPIVLDAAGRVPTGEIWLTDGLSYKFVLKDANDVLIATYDNIIGINSNFVNFVNQQEIQTATAGQTVFTLTTMQYQPGTGNLSVFVDGVNQYGPGAQYAYTETSSTVVTFVSGLHVGASVKFTTTEIQNVGVADASQITYTYPAANAIQESVESRLAQYVNVKDFGADSTGTISCSTAFSNADLSGASNLTITAGTYLVSTNVTFTLPVTMDAGAVLQIPNGVTVTFNGGFYAGIYQTFNCSGTGKVEFNQENLTIGYPEWWGAEANGGVDSYSGIMACLTACDTTQLSAGTYIVSSTIKILDSNKTLRGVGEQYWGTTGWTRLLVASGTLTALQIGPDNDPGGVANFLRGITVEDLYVGRSVLPVIASACTSVFCKFTVGCNLNNVKATESIYSFQFAGTVGLVATRCAANRSVAGTGSGTDIWYGYYINGLITVGFAGGNASIYLNYCTAGCNIAALQTSNSVGFYINGAFSDTYLESPETVTCNVGITVEGDASTSNVASNLDLMIKNPVNDQFGTWGIYLHNINKFGSAIINSGYYGSSSTAAIGLYINQCLGAVTVEGGQFVLIGALSITAGIGIVNSQGVVLNRPQILDCANRAISMSGSSNCDIRPLIKNHQNNITSAVELLTNCSRNYVAPDIYGSSNLIQVGVALVGTSSTYNEVNCTLINPTVINGGSNNKLTYNATQITSTGTFGTNNLASGIMG